MIFQRTLQRELASIAGATFTVLFSILLTFSLIKILGEAAGGKVASGDVVALIAFAALNYLPTILILTSFISVLAAVTRSYRDSEMVVWFASGVSLAQWVRPVLTFGFPIVVLTAVLAFFATPWAQTQSAEYVERFKKREDVLKVSPGQFKESASSDRIFFVEAVSENTKAVQNVFVNTQDKNGNTVVVAKEGVIENDARGNRYLVLKNGRRYQGTPGRADFQSMEFERYSMRVSTQATAIGADLTVASMSTMSLLEKPNPYTWAELLWRISLPITCLMLMLLAIPLGFVNPRAGSSVNLIIALLIFFTYDNFNKLLETAVKQEKMSFYAAWWPLHLAAAIFVLALFAWRLNVNHRYHPLVLWAKMKRRAP
jgi:lipopolysaccharide export system permease protein